MIQNVSIATTVIPTSNTVIGRGEEETGHDEERQRDADPEAEQADARHDDADAQSLPPCGAVPETVHRGRRDERDRGQDREEQRRAVQPATQVVELTEPLRERDREQERNEHLHARAGRPAAPAAGRSTDRAARLDRARRRDPRARSRSLPDPSGSSSRSSSAPVREDAARRSRCDDGAAAGRNRFAMRVLTHPALAAWCRRRPARTTPRRGSPLRRPRTANRCGG